MVTNQIICYYCKQSITKKQLTEAVSVTDINGKIQYKHKIKTKSCKINFKLKPIKNRKSDILNKRQFIKQSSKIYNRKKIKSDLNKEIKKGDF